MTALLERLHAKHNASRPWQETCKVVRQAMVRLRQSLVLKIVQRNLHCLGDVTASGGAF